MSQVAWRRGHQAPSSFHHVVELALNDDVDDGDDNNC